MASFSDLNLTTVPDNKVSSDSTGHTIHITPSTTVATDIWRKPGPPVVDTFNAPVWYRRLPLGEFKSAKVTVRLLVLSFVMSCSALSLSLTHRLAIYVCAAAWSER